MECYSAITKCTIDTCNNVDEPKKRSTKDFTAEYCIITL